MKFLLTFAAVLSLFLAACNSTGTAHVSRGPETGAVPLPSVTPAATATPESTAAPTPIPTPWIPLACPDIFDAATLPTYSLEMPPAVEQTLRDEAANHVENEHPATLRYNDETYDVTIRNRGNRFSCGAKLQLAITFDAVDRTARFHGVRRIDLDSGQCNLLTERLSLAFARELGFAAQCANHAQLYVNGGYEGLLTNLEHPDKDYLTRNFGRGSANDGTIWKDGTEPKTNKTDPGWARQSQFWSASTTDLAWLEANGDVDEWVREWALEAAFPATDNYYVAGWNYTLYDHPARGFLFLPRDWDKAEPYSAEWQSYDPIDSATQAPSQLVLANPVWRARYIAALRDIVDQYDPAHIDALAKQFWLQVREPASRDPTLHVGANSQPPQYLLNEYHARIQYLRDRLDALPPE